MKIPYVNLKAFGEEEWDELQPLLKKIITSGKFIQGEEVEVFEKEIAEFCGTKHAIAVNSGTDALILSMRSLGIGPGDEVITCPNSFIASASSIFHVGAEPVFVDVLEDQNMNPDLIEKAITNKTKAILPVHLTGRVCQMDKIMAIAHKYKLHVIEDAAQSIGSMYENKKSGSFGNFGCFSTHPLKNLNAFGDGGFITSDDEERVNRIKRLRNHGLKDRITADEWGYVSRMDTIQACILLYHLKKLPLITKQRRSNADLYRSVLSDISDIFIAPCKSQEFNTFHTFVIQVEERDKLQAHLLDKGIKTTIHYPIPIHLQLASKDLPYKKGDFPVTETQSKRILTLPVNQFLGENEISYICDKISEFYKRR